MMPAILDPAALVQGTPLLLHPTDDAVELGSEFLGAAPPPYTLFVPDGSWRQAGEMGHREPSLRSLQRVKLPTSAVSGYQLRKETKPGGLATIEAIARALGVLESPYVEQELSRIFALMVERTLHSRGAPPGSPRP